MSKKDYEVGDKKPPKEFQFKKGQSGNPAGRPKGSRSRATIAKHWLKAAEEMKDPIEGITKLLKQEDIITLALIKKARNGDVQAYNALMNSAYGLPKQEIEQTITEKPIFNGLELDVTEDNGTEEDSELKETDKGN